MFVYKLDCVQRLRMCISHILILSFSLAAREEEEEGEVAAAAAAAAAVAALLLWMPRPCERAARDK